MTTHSLASALLTLRTPEDIELFLSDVMTKKEMQIVQDRFEIAQRLYAGQTYAQISKDLNASSTTIARTKTWIAYGNGGLHHVLRRFSSPIND